ncbi:bifunctional hydroxymethylpyrimidine kinase/phosphomethylpyrimidine kinase [Blastococcus brunescens]|uniref:Bifunctional hydroxymethylpyrimidine kinase/phosphomethylpyrimidine kinase n=1 Tax=Blastococcus brunescens TaxID=1564165 RepID=A0ABZ1B510_9ACTN|nr:bifunctional hydroxymethylpyrimidine kinase/phosphomethylpyrimidine kinase [Blastococcus sp. BMG 8361]WRL65889.1 bifunctional hydroxymethylpyrimidine kinase/phosphomethylpyrimidine kinase [Blastococcus sp. BMG 8361]
MTGRRMRAAVRTDSPFPTGPERAAEIRRRIGGLHVLTDAREGRDALGVVSAAVPDSAAAARGRAHPDLREAEVLLDGPIHTLADQREAARALGALGPATVVVKGGHPVSDAAGEAINVVWDGSSVHELRSPRIDTRNNHGTGCTFAAATAAWLARGLDAAAALRAAKAYVLDAVAGAAVWRLGGGHGPLDHFGWIATQAEP